MELLPLTPQQQILFTFLSVLAVIMITAVAWMWLKGWRKTSAKSQGKAVAGVKEQSLLSKKIGEIFLLTKKIDDKFLDSLEELLYTSDLGPSTVETLLKTVREKLSRGELSDLNTVKRALADEILLILDKSNSKTPNSDATISPQVILVVGVNGVGKTTSIGKLAYFYAQKNKKVMVVAADTFRAAAQDQLNVWAERANVSFYTTDQTQDPGAVAYQGLQKAIAENCDVVIVDTAGRLHNNENLMEELKKVKRVLQKIIPAAPQQILLVIDANSGQNAIHQAKQFHQILTLTGLVVTKLDGSAKGGVIVGISHEIGVNPEFIGVGEKMSDLKIFSPTEYAGQLLSL